MAVYGAYRRVRYSAAAFDKEGIEHWHCLAPGKRGFAFRTREVARSWIVKNWVGRVAHPECLFLFGFRRIAGSLPVMMAFHPLFPLGLHRIPFLLLVCIQELTNLVVGCFVKVHHF